MKPEVHLSVDIETMSSRPDAAIISIGAVCFTSDGIGTKTFDRQISAVDAIGDRSESTMEWWSKQDIEARGRAFGGISLPRTVAEEFDRYVSEVRPSYVWANAPSFDCVILRNLYERLDITFPWHFKTEQCMRTITRIGRKRGISWSECYEGIQKHDALGDATAQARVIHKILTEIGGF